MFSSFKKKEGPALEYPSVNQFREAVLKVTNKHNAAEEADYQEALKRVRKSLQETMWEGYKVLLFNECRINRCDTRLKGGKYDFESVSGNVLGRVGATLVKELEDKGFIATYRKWNDIFQAIVVEVPDV